jgi:hypothetical protein
MQTLTSPITGKEGPFDTTSPLGALTNFYAAFNLQNLDQMQANWLQTEEASMSNPLGGIKRGWLEIESVYKNIFSGPATVYVEFYDYSIHASGSMFVAVGRERGSLEINNETIELAIRTSRIYTLHKAEWKQIHHHGSMDNPDLLAHYQKVLLA